MRILIVLLLCSMSASAQNFIKPIPPPPNRFTLKAGEAPIFQNSWRPMIGLAAVTNDGTSLAGGIGVGFNHNKWDAAAQAWITQWAISFVAYLNTNAATVVGLQLGLFNGLLQVGGGWNITTSKGVLLYGPGIKPF